MDYNQRPDYLVAILKHKFNIPGNLGYLHIAQIDPQGKYILMLYHPPPKGEEVEFKIPLDPPVKSLFEIRPRMAEWKYNAFQHYQVVSQARHGRSSAAWYRTGQPSAASAMSLHLHGAEFW